MKVVIFGATGKTGSHLVSQALKQGHHVTAYVRRLSSINKEHPHLKIVVGNVVDLPKLKEAITGADACISVLGGNSLRHPSPDIVDGINCIVHVMEQANVLRFIYMSSIGAGESRDYLPQPLRFMLTDIVLRVPLADHNTNEKRIMDSKLRWTIVRPGGLTNKGITANLKFGSEKTTLKGSVRISRANVAAFMLYQLNKEEFVNKAVWLYG